MSRIVLIAVLAVAACEGGSGGASGSATSGSATTSGSTVASGSAVSAPPAEAAVAGPARKVIEVTGDVTVRGKPVAVGDELAADDVIETGAHGHIVVLLPIDDSHWELGPNQRAKVSETGAWTVVTDAGVTPPDAAVSVDAAAAPPAQKAPPKPPPHPDSGDSESAGGGINGSTVGAAKIASDAAADLIGSQEGALRRCLSAGARVQIHVRVNDAGNVSTSVDGAANPTVSTCLKGVIAKVKLAHAKASVNMTIENSSQ